MSLFPQQSILLDLSGADVTYYPNFFSSQEAAAYYETLLKETPWKQEDIKVFGKVHPQPRLTALYASNNQPYSYSTISMHPQQFTFALSEIKKRIETTVLHNFTTCLLNLYRDGKDSNGWHSDDEKELGPNPVIASVSFGASRIFKFREKANTKNVHKIALAPGSLLLMKGRTQHLWQHQIPKTTKPIGQRVNLTFRILNE